MRRNSGWFWRLRPAWTPAVLLLTLISLDACAGQQKVYTFKPLKAGKHSNYPLAQGRCFKTLDEYRKFAGGVRALGENCEFPADLPAVDWGREMVVALFAGPSDTSQRVTFIRAGDFAGALAIFWRRESDVLESVFADEPPIVTPAIESATPFLVGTLTRTSGRVTFIQSQKLLDGP